LDIYQLAEVGEREGSVWMACTHDQDAQEILVELQRAFPDYRMRPRKKYTSGSGDETGWRIDQCGGRHRHALWWLIRHLCSRGWEPFAVAHEPSRELFAAPLYVFRKKTQP
jgi:hypothetical protein